VISRKGNVPVAVVEAGPADAPLLAELHAESFDNPWTADEFARLCATPGASCLIAASDGEPVAFALVRSAAGEAEIITIATRPFARRRGVARRLLLEIAARLEEGGGKDLFIEVARSNDAAVALYRALGFAEAGLRPGYYLRPEGVREDAIVMRRAI
jgi:ribosomal-protein-alanine N-acetyltransferase